MPWVKVPQSGQSSVEPDRPPDQRRLAGPLPSSDRPAGELRGHRALPRHLLPGGQLDVRRSLGGPGHQVQDRSPPTSIKELWVYPLSRNFRPAAPPRHEPAQDLKQLVGAACRNARPFWRGGRLAAPEDRDAWNGSSSWRAAELLALVEQEEPSRSPNCVTCSSVRRPRRARKRVRQRSPSDPTAHPSAEAWPQLTAMLHRRPLGPGPHPQLQPGDRVRTAPRQGARNSRHRRWRSA